MTLAIDRKKDVACHCDWSLYDLWSVSVFRAHGEIVKFKESSGAAYWTDNFRGRCPFHYYVAQHDSGNGMLAPGIAT